jgi:DNA-binding Lrp family transcriptional regulator
MVTPVGSLETDERRALAWRAAAPTAAFILKVEEASRNNRDLVDGLLLAAIQSANVSAISSDPELQVRHAILAQPPPDDLRRPVSISAIAHSLRLPFETARRRVRRLTQAGVLIVTARGVLISRAAMVHPNVLQSVMIRHERLKEFYFEARDLGVLPPAPQSSSAPAPVWDAPPLRLTNRLVWEYMLRATDDMGAAVGDTTNGVILLAMAQENTAGFAPEALAAWTRDPAALARPVRNSRLAQRLNVSTETLRRRVNALESRGLCARGPNGLIALAPPFLRAALDRMVEDNLVNLQRLFARLRQFGVLDAWDDAYARGKAASR